MPKRRSYGTQRGGGQKPNMTGSILDSAPLSWLPPVQKGPLVCKTNCSTVLVWMLTEEKRARDSCEVMGKGKRYLA